MMDSLATLNPYVGLRPFEREDSLYFFGRRSQSIELMELLHRTNFVAVVGSSGCGKSSLIRAGLIPALLGGFLVEDRDRWRIAVMKPGDAPRWNLSAALCRTAGADASPETVAALCKKLEEGHTQALIDHALPLLGRDANLLLLIDQFEEIFAFRGTDDEELHPSMSRTQRRERARRRAEAADFVDLMIALTERTGLPIYAVLTMRTDFLGDCDRFYGLPEAMNRSRYLVPRLTRQQLREAIEGPALLSGAQIAPRLVDMLLNELGDRSDRLPVLQHALLRTWDNWQKKGRDGMIDLPHYEASGGLQHALSKHAEEAMSGFDTTVVARIFKRLTDTDPSHRRIRRPARFNELVAVSGTTPDVVRNLLERFRENGRNFLFISETDDPANPRVDISHESLIRRWDRLKRWVDQERDARDHYLELVKRARNKSALLRDTDLDAKLQWQKETDPTAAWAGRYNQNEGDYQAAMRYLKRSHTRRTRLYELTGGVTILLLALAGWLIYEKISLANLEARTSLIAQQNEEIQLEFAVLLGQNDSLKQRADAFENLLDSLLSKLENDQLATADLVEFRRRVSTDTAQVSVEPTYTSGSRALTETQLESAAQRAGIDAAVLRALIDVQSRGSGFIDDGKGNLKPKIRFDRTIFWQQLKQYGLNPENYAKQYDNIVSDRAGGYYGGIREYERLDEAKKINEQAALESTSWGLFQVLGLHYSALGFRSIYAFVDAQERSEYDQLRTGLRYLEVNNLLPLLRDKDWKNFTYRYFGEGYEKYGYDELLSKAYWKNRPQIFVHIQSENQRQRAQRLADALKKNDDYVVAGIQRVDTGPVVTELRFFRSTEKDEAIAIVRALRRLGVTAELVDLSARYASSKTINPRQYELWFAASF